MQKLIWQNSKGEEINLTSGHYGITNWQGFSEVSLNVQSQTVPFQDGSVYLDALLDERELSVTLAIQDNNDLELRYQLRRELIHALNPKLGEGYLIYTNDFISKRIKCVANVPVFENHNSNDTGTPKASLTWTACEPYWEDLEEQEKFFAVGEIAEIENNGDIPCQVEVEFFGSSQKAQIENLTTEKKLEVDTTIGDGIVINTNIGQKSVVRENLNFDVIQNSIQMEAICYSPKLKLYVEVGQFGQIKISKDCFTWTTISLGIQLDMYTVCYSEEKNLFVAIGNNRVITSSNGINWVVNNPGITIGSNKVIYSEEKDLFVVVGGSGNICTSSDGINWTSRTSGISNILNSICYSDDLNKFVAVGYSGTILTSSNGIEWTSQTSGTSQVLYSVVYGNNKFVVVGANGTILTSSNGIEWTSQTSGTSQGLTKIIYSKGLNLYLVTFMQGAILTSSDGINWNEQIVGNYGFRDLLYAEELNLFTMISSSMNDYDIILTSSNGTEWTSQTSGTSQTLYSVIYSEEKDLFVAVGANGTILTSSNGTEWTSQTSGTSQTLYSVIYSEEKDLFVAVGANGTILTSIDVVTWSSQISNVSVILRSICYSDRYNRFVAVGYSGTILISSNGINWNSIESGTSQTLYSVIYSEEKDLFVAVGANGTILTSNYGIYWDLQSSGINSNITSICYSDELKLFIAVGIYALTSQDGIKWTLLYLNDSYNCITFASEYAMIIIAGLGKIKISFDGKEWNNKQSNTVSYLYGICYSNKKNKIVMVGISGTIINSDFEQAENIIQNLTEDSDMNFNLEVGENKLRLVRDNGSLTSRIIYRQKYIGV